MCRSIAAMNVRVDDSTSSVAFIIHLNLLLVPILAKQLKNLLILTEGNSLNLNEVNING